MVLLIKKENEVIAKVFIDNLLPINVSNLKKAGKKILSPNYHTPLRMSNKNPQSIMAYAKVVASNTANVIQKYTKPKQLVYTATTIIPDLKHRNLAIVADQ